MDTDQASPAASSPSARLGQYIHARRSRLQLTQSQLASRASLNPVSISAIETGKQGPPRKATAIRLEKALALKPGAIAHILAGGDPAPFEDEAPPPPEDTFDTKHLGRCIRARRLQLQLTQEQLAQRAELNPISVSLLENGRQGPPRDGTAMRLEEALAWKPGAIAHILAGADPRPYTNDPPSATEISIDIARSILTAVNNLRSDLPERPELAVSLLEMLKQTETKLTQLVEQQFTREALQVLMDINNLHQALRTELGLPPGEGPPAV